MIQLDRQTEKIVERLKQMPVPVVYLGQCENCQRRIPLGYLPVVTRWKVQNGRGWVVQVPEVIYCQDCKGVVEYPKGHRKRRFAPDPLPKTSTLTLKEIAIKIYSVMSVSQGMGSRKLARLAGIEWSPVIRRILKKLMVAGKVLLEQGKWRKV